jgi:hypothetical protein
MSEIAMYLIGFCAHWNGINIAVMLEIGHGYRDGCGFGFEIGIGGWLNTKYHKKAHYKL